MQVPFPQGRYNIFPNTLPGRDGWWTLQDVNWSRYVSALAYKLGLRRAGHNLHLGRYSIGCITVAPTLSDEYYALTGMLEREAPNNNLVVVP